MTTTTPKTTATTTTTTTTTTKAAPTQGHEKIFLNVNPIEAVTENKYFKNKLIFESKRKNLTYVFKIFFDNLYPLSNVVWVICGQLSGSRVQIPP